MKKAIAGLSMVLFVSIVWAQQPVSPAQLTNQEDSALARARQLYPPEVTWSLFVGKVPAPAGFDRAMVERLGQERFDALRSSGENVTGREHDAAAVVLLRLKVDPETLDPARRMTVRFLRSEYPVASGKTSGFFHTGQDADILLSGIDFNNAGGPLLFNHPMGIATDDKRLLLADTYNNRVLIWNTLPSANVPPDLVLGQKDFIGNNSGTGRDQMNWPVNVATDGKRIVVTDTDNDRILIWNQWPTKSGATADIVLEGDRSGERNVEAGGTRFHWPWSVWTNGEKVAVSSTHGGGILIWNRFPTRDNQPADLVLRGGGKLGTPRTITSDGRHLIVGDHNPRMGGVGGGTWMSGGGTVTFFWKTFPTRDDQPFDFYRTEPGQRGGPWLRGCFTREGRLLLMASTLHIWNAFPEDEKAEPDFSLRGYNFWGGDHTGVAAAGGRVYIVTGNANKIVVYNSIPTKRNQLPDFAIGSPDIHTNTLETNFIISNPQPASNGKNLFVSSDIDQKLYVWKKLPDKSGAHPDLVYSFTPGACDIALWRETLALAGDKTVRVWKKLPLDGNLPDVILDKRIGSVQLGDIRGVALDDRYFYLADRHTGKVYVWKGIPSKDSEPTMTLNVEEPWMLSSDGDYLAVSVCFRHMVLIYAVNELRADARPWVIGGHRKDGPPASARFNGVAKALAAGGHLFVAEGFNRVHAWRRIEDACAGRAADAILGQPDFDSIRPGTGRNRLHTACALSFDGSYLWVGEVKFSERLLRFSPSLSQDEGHGDSGQIQNRQSGNYPSAPKDPVVIPEPGLRLAHDSDPAAGLAAAQSETRWPKFRGDLLNSGYSTSSAPHIPLVAWRKKIPGAGAFWSSPSILKDKLYVGNSNGSLYCLNATTGDLIWTFYGNSFAIFSSPAIAYGMVFFGAADRKIYALPADDPDSDGTISETEIIWDYTVGPSTGGVNNVVPSSPAIKDGKLFMGAIDQYFYCFNATNGQVIWKTWTPYRGQHAFSSSPALYKGRVFAATGNQPGRESSGRLYCFSETTGRIIWEFDIDDITYSSPVIDQDNDRVIIANSGDWIANAGNRTYRMYSLAIGGYTEGMDQGIPDSHSGNSDLVWSYDTRRYVYSSPATHDGRLFFGGSDGNLRCVDARTGKTVWVYETPARGGSGIMGSPAVADGMVFVGTADGRLVAVPENDPNSDGVISPDEIVWSYEIGGRIVCSPAIANGAVFIGSRDGVMYCFRTSAHKRGRQWGQTGVSH